MIVKSIKLENFRNLEDINIELDDTLNIFIGDNGQGKTNLLESIYLCSIGKTFRLNSENDLVKFNKKNFNIEVGLEKQATKSLKRINFSYTKNQKKLIKINGLKLEKNSELIGVLNNVIFTPDDLRIVKGSPNERRKFVNIDISQIKPKYKYLLRNYNKVITQRNILLKQGSFCDEKVLSVWNDYMIDIGTEIIIYRREYLKNLRHYASNIYSNISESKEVMDLIYKCDIGDINDLDKSEIVNLFRKKLNNVRESEFIRKITLCGPQKDDIIFKINNKDFKYFGSQGQQRSAILSLKLAEIEIIKNEVGEYPILLLDDVLSELDNKRKKYLIESIKNLQTIITSTDDYDLNKIILDKRKKVFKINEGKIVNIKN